MRACENGRHVLNSADRSVLALRQNLREAGYGGLADQMQIWLDGRVNPTALRKALVRLNRAHPIVTARLTRPRWGAAFWQFRPGAECIVHEVWLKSAAENAVLRHAAHILATATDPAETDAVQFHLLHLPDGRDVILLQYDHALMDINGAKLLLREINDLWSGSPRAQAKTGGTPVPPDGTPIPPDAVPPNTDDIGTYLGRFSLRQRLRAVWNLPRQVRALDRSSPVNLSDAEMPTPGGTLRIAVRELDERQTEAFTRRTTQLCGFPSLSMAVLAGIFRALLRHTPRPVGPDSALFLHLGTNLRGRGDRGPIFHNLSSLLPLMVRPDDAGDWEKLVLLLNRQMRERLHLNTDLAYLQWAWWLRRLPSVQQRAAWNVLFRRSLDYGYMGVLAEKGDRFCGVSVRRIFPVAQTYAPPGLSIAPSMCGGRLVLPALYVADAVPEARLHAFLDTLVADLVGEVDDSQIEVGRPDRLPMVMQVS